MTKKVLVTEKLAQAGLDRLAEKGLQVDVKLKMSTDELIEAIPEYDALVVRSATHVTREVVAAASKLRIIGRAGVGVDNVDVEAATEAGIIVCNAPTSNIVSAAEHTMALMLATLTLHGITPGVRLMADNPDIVYATFILLIMANLALIPAAWICIRGFGKIIAFPTAVLLGLIVICSLIGVYLPRSSMFDIWVTLVIGVVAFLMRLTDFPVAPLLIGYVLSNQLEYRMSQVAIYMGGGSLVDYTLEHPVAIVLFAVALVLLVLPFFRKTRDKRTCEPNF